MSVAANLREPEAYSYAKFLSTLTESSHQALFESGDVLPIYIRGYGSGNTELFVETEYPPFFVDPRKLPGFIRLEETSEEKDWLAGEAQKAEAADEAAKRPRNLTEAKQAAEQGIRNEMGWRYSNRQTETALVSSKWNSFAQAARRERNAKFGAQ